MDKIAKYQQVISGLLNEYAAIKKTVTPDIKAQVMMDRENNHYQLLSLGWHNNRFVYNVSFHFDIIDEKIWIQQNNTDVLIADELMERGVEKSDIVLGFISEKARGYSGYAMN
jgi:XisI protein